MNLLTLTFCFAATLVVVSCRKCKSSEDCRDNECCVALSVVQVRRSGICVRLNRKGGHCSEPESEIEYYGGKYYMKYCPCQEGLSCQPRNLKKDETDMGKFLKSLRCQMPASTAAPKVKEPTSEPEVTKPTPEPEVKEPTSQPEVPEPEVKEPTPEPEVPEPTPETEVPDENDQEEVRDIDEGTGNEGTGDEETGDELPDEIGEGPGGEPPRDDDCLDWEYPC